MSSKRKNDDSTSANSSKIRVLANEPDRNTLIAMPDHILEQVMSCLDFPQKKIFSEVCKKFNGIFSWKRNLKNVWFHVQKGHLPSDINRPYSMISTSIDNDPSSRKYIHKRIWKLMLPNLKGFRFKEQSSMLPREFIDCLQNFQSLTQFDIDVSSEFVKEKLLKLSRSDQIVKLEHLEHLVISLEVFCYLEGRRIDFVTTKLQSIKIKFDRLKGVTDAVDRIIDCRKVGALISKQTNLKMLHLEGLRSELFVNSVEMQSQVQNLTLKVFDEVNDARQQDHLCDFINSQSNLQSLNVEFNVSKNIIMTNKMNRLFEQRLDFPRVDVNIFTYQKSRDHEYKHFNWYTMDELQKSASGPINLTPKRLELHQHCICDGDKLKEIIAQLVLKFPCLTTVKVSLGGYKHATIDSFISLNDLQHLKNLKYDCHTCAYLRGVNLQHLESFSLVPRCEKFNKSRDLQEFLKRHPDIREINLGIFPVKPYYNQSDPPEFIAYIDMLTFSLVNLKKLMKFSASHSHLQRNDSLLALIQEHANPGFVLNDYQRSYRKCGEFPEILMKRYDGQLVYRGKSDTTWEILQ